MAIIKTVIKIPSLDSIYNVPGDFSPTDVQNMYSSRIRELATMTSTQTVVDTPEGQVREIVFSLRSGNKG
jgi:hypothetical protein